MADISAFRIPNATTELGAVSYQVSAALRCLVASLVTLVTPDVNAQCSLRLEATPFH